MFTTPVTHESQKESVLEMHAAALTDLRKKPVLILVKESKLGCDCLIRKASEAEVLKQYEVEGVNPELILKAHKANQAAILKARQLFPDAQVFSLYRDNPTEISAAASNAGIVLAIGGDDHFKAAAQVARDSLLIAINSDPGRSVGALCTFQVEDLTAIKDNFESGEICFEEWSLLESALETTEAGKRVIRKLPPAVSEISLADKRSIYTFRANYELGLRHVPVKGSGLLVANGAGSGGWFSSSSRYIFPLGRLWARTESRAEFVVREPYGEISKLEDVWGSFSVGETLRVTSSGNHEPEISIDSVSNYSFPRGSSLLISLAKNGLKVLSRRTIED